MMSCAGLGDRCIVPGKRVGTLELGMCHGDVLHLAFLRYPELDLEVVLRTVAPSSSPTEARVIAIAVSGGDWTGLPRPRDLRAFVEERMGEATLVGERALYASGVSVHYESSGRAVTVVVRAPFLPDLFPAPRADAQRGSMPRA